MTQQELQELRDATYAAVLALTKGGVQSYQLMGRTVTKLDLEKLRKALADYDQQLETAKRGGRTRTALVGFTSY